jgi:hypothetical protein
VPRTARDAFVIERAADITRKKTVYFVLKTSQIAKGIVTINSHSSTTSCTLKK